LAAVRITFRQSKESAFEELIKLEDLDWRTDAFLNSIDLTENQRDEIYCNYGIEEYAELFIVATNPKYRNNGLSMELYIRSISFLRAEGFKLIKCILTNPTTRRAGTRLGFETYYKLDYKLLTDRNGELLFPRDKVTEYHFATIALKHLT
jgi:GNAT superfamily N-acetyltransferase